MGGTVTASAPRRRPLAWPSDWLAARAVGSITGRRSPIPRLEPFLSNRTAHGGCGMWPYGMSSAKGSSTSAAWWIMSTSGASRPVRRSALECYRHSAKNLPKQIRCLYHELYEIPIPPVPKEDQDICRNILSTTAIAYRSLRKSEVEDLVGLRESVDFDIVVSKLCPFYLEIYNGNVCYVHTSARDYVRHRLADRQEVTRYVEVSRNGTAMLKAGRSPRQVRVGSVNDNELDSAPERIPG